MDYDPKKFTWWKAALAGENVPLHADQPMQGFYAYKAGSKAAPQPVAIWYGNDELLCKLGDKPYRDAHGMWISVMRNPIPHKVYLAVMAGDAWPHELKIVMPGGEQDSSLIGHNSGDDIDKLKGNVKEWTDQAIKAAKSGAPKTKAEADKLSDTATKLKDLANELDDERKKKSAPVYEQWKEINAEFNGVINPGLKAAQDLGTLVLAFQRAEFKRREEAAAALQAQVNAEAEKTGEAPVVIQAAPVRTGTRGKTQSTRKVAIVVVEDWKAVLGYIAGMETVPPVVQEAVKEALMGLLNLGQTIPGARKDVEDRLRG